MAVRGVFAQADVGDDEKAREAAAEEADGLDDGTFWVVGGSAQGVFDVGAHGYAEEDHGLQAFADEGFEVRDYFVDAAAVLVGQGRNEGFFFVVVGDEERVYEHRLRSVISVGVCRESKREGDYTLVSCLSACHDLASG